MPDRASHEGLPEALERLQREVTELRDSRRRLVAAADADRRAIERALHDGVQQYLVAAAGDLRRLTGLVAGDQGAKAILGELATDVQQALDAAARLAQLIYPPLLEARGLAIALRSVAMSAGIRASIKVLAPRNYPPEITAAVYWCCVEALSAAPAGTEATVNVLEANGALAFEVTLAGDQSEGQLERLADRVEALGGRLTTQRRQPGGSFVAGSLPLLRRP